MASRSLSINVHITGVTETLAAFRRLPRDASDALREGSLALAEALAVKVRAAAESDSAQSALMGPTVKARRDRIPTIEAGGSTRVASSRVPAYKILFGSEFGARTLPQYRPHVGRGSYWMFKAVEDNEAQVAAAWLKVADDIVRRFTAGDV